jgi:hypothetical protein
MQAIVLKVMATEDKKEYSNKTLVVDEAHGLYMDYNYKPAAIRNLINIFQYFKSVVIMSGTLIQITLQAFQLIDHMGSISLNKR